MGNPRSDVDLFLLHDGSDDPPVQQIIDGAVRIDVEYRRPSEIDRLLDGLAGVPDDRTEGLDRVPSLARLDDAARLFNALPVDDGPGRAYVERIQAGEDALRRCRILRATSICASKSEDVRGAQEAGDRRQELEISGRLLLESLEAYLAGCGEYYVGHKWVFAKLRRTAHHEPVLRRLDALLFDVGLEDAETVDARVSLAQQLLAVAFTLGWHRPQAAEWAAQLPVRAGADVRRLDPQWVPIRYGSVVLLEGLDKNVHVQLTPQGLLLWALAAAIPATDLYPVFLKTMSNFSDELPTEGDVEEYISQLVERGLLLPG
ncbi:hypothetical protein GCM10029963_24520 [Micromonospora andamanensis]|nr:hypothetical protein Vwe01_16630 [Micromonospora andamanensis]